MREKLLEAAFIYKKSGLWKKLWDSEVFAIKLSNGEVGYISIMGQAGEYCALGLYIGDKGFESYRIIADEAEEATSELQYHEMLLQQDCLQLALESKDELTPEEVEEVRAYAKNNGMRLAGKNAYPHFVKYKPNYHPWKVQTEEDEAALLEAIKVCVLLSKKLDKFDKQAMGIVDINRSEKEVPLYEITNSELELAGTVVLPILKKPEYEYSQATNDIMIATMKQMPHKGIWEAELVRLPEPMQERSHEAPYYPLFLMMVNRVEGTVLPAPLIMGAKADLQEMLQRYAEAWRMQKAYPKEIRCRDERTYAFLKDISEKTNVKIHIYNGKMNALDEAELSMLTHMTSPDESEMMEQLLELVESVLEMSNAELRNLPALLLEQLEMSLDYLPNDMATELRRKLKVLKC